jgi:hypothetical protein
MGTALVQGWHRRAQEHVDPCTRHMNLSSSLQELVCIQEERELDRPVHHYSTAANIQNNTCTIDLRQLTKE